MNLIAIGLQALVVNLLLSMRSSAWGSLGFRAILAAVYHAEVIAHKVGEPFGTLE